MRLRSATLGFLPLLFSAACGPIGGGASGPTSVSGDDGGGSSGGGSQPALGPDGGILMAPGGYHVMGNQVYDAKGKTHLFRGLDRPSLEWSSQGDHLSVTDFVNMGQAWHANVVRIPLNQDFWLSDPSNPSYDNTYPRTVDNMVHFAETNGLDVILDLHWSDQGDYSTGAACLAKGGCQQCMADQNSLTFWTQLATKYANDGHVLFELYNEPHSVSWSSWLSGGSSAGCNTGGSFTVAGMQQLYDAVRATGAQNLVVIGGLNWAYDLSGVPANRVQGYNIIYNTHPYASKCAGGACGVASFTQNFGFLAATDPVIATEFGDGDCSAGFYQTFTDYTQSNGIHWTGWAYYVPGASDICGFPALISDWNGTAVQGSGTTVQAALIASGSTPGGIQADAGGADASAMDGGGADATSADDAGATDAGGGDGGITPDM